MEHKILEHAGSTRLLAARKGFGDDGVVDEVTGPAGREVTLAHGRIGRDQLRRYLLRIFRRGCSEYFSISTAPRPASNFQATPSRLMASGVSALDSNLAFGS